MTKLSAIGSGALAAVRISALRALRSEDGQGAVEYALVVLGIAAVIALGVAGFAGEITNFMSAAGGKLASFI